MLKKCVWMILLIMLFVISDPTTAFSQDASMRFSFELNVDGYDTKEVKPGDVITLSLHLKRMDEQMAYMMYAFQDELRYDANFFELMEDSSSVYNGVVMNDIKRTDGFHEVYINYLSMSGGTRWDQDVLLGTIQLKVIADGGVAKIASQDYLVSSEDGKTTYPCEANELLVICTTDCTVRFMTNGGNQIENQIVPYGEKITQPQDPLREGMQFVGWFSDINLTDAWDFDTDVVETNMSLYAKWEPAENITEDNSFNILIIYAVGIFLLLIIILLVLFCIHRKRHRRD